MAIDQGQEGQKESLEDLFNRTPVHFVYFYVKTFPGSTLAEILGQSPWGERIVKWAIRRLLEIEAIYQNEDSGYVAILMPSRMPERPNKYGPKPEADEIEILKPVIEMEPEPEDDGKGIERNGRTLDPDMDCGKLLKTSKPEKPEKSKK